MCARPSCSRWNTHLDDAQTHVHDMFGRGAEVSGSLVALESLLEQTAVAVVVGEVAVGHLCVGAWERARDERMGASERICMQRTTHSNALLDEIVLVVPQLEVQLLPFMLRASRRLFDPSVIQRIVLRIAWRRVAEGSELLVGLRVARDGLCDIGRLLSSGRSKLRRRLGNVDQADEASAALRASQRTEWSVYAAADSLSFAPAHGIVGNVSLPIKGVVWRQVYLSGRVTLDDLRNEARRPSRRRHLDVACVGHGSRWGMRASDGRFGSDGQDDRTTGPNGRPGLAHDGRATPFQDHVARQLGSDRDDLFNLEKLLTIPRKKTKLQKLARVHTSQGLGKRVSCMGVLPLDPLVTNWTSAWGVLPMVAVSSSLAKKSLMPELESP